MLALPGDAGRYLLVLKPDAAMGHLAGLVATGDTVEERTVSLIEKLMGFTLIALNGLPNNFECDGERIGRFFVIADTVCLEGALSRSRPSHGSSTIRRPDSFSASPRLTP